MFSDFIVLQQQKKYHENNAKIRILFTAYFEYIKYKFTSRCIYGPSLTIYIFIFEEKKTNMRNRFAEI